MVQSDKTEFDEVIYAMSDECTLKQISDFLEEYTGRSTSYWYPLCVLKNDIPVVAYNVCDIYDDGNIEQIEKTLRNCGIYAAKCFQMDHRTEFFEENMIDLLYEEDSDGYNFPYYVETYYFDDSKSWMIYVSHENTIAFTGDKLVKAAKENIHIKYIYD